MRTIPWAPDQDDDPDDALFLPRIDDEGLEVPPDDVELPGEPKPTPWLEPEDRGRATLSAHGDLAYVENLIRPGRIVVWAAEEGTGKSTSVNGELGIRVAVAGGTFAGTWPVLQTGPVLVLSEMHPDDDFEYERDVLASLGLDRSALNGRYFRLPLLTAAGGPAVLSVAAWRSWIVDWLRHHEAILLVFDTATGAAQVDPWGKGLQQVIRFLRTMLEAYPALAIVLTLHLKKPTGRAERRISDVLGEWGRWADVLVLQQSAGGKQTKIETIKRVRVRRRIVATQTGGLLVDPIDADGGKGPKVPLEEVAAAVAADPGVSMKALAKALGIASVDGREVRPRGRGIGPGVPRRDRLEQGIQAVPGRIRPRPPPRRGGSRGLSGSIERGRPPPRRWRRGRQARGGLVGLVSP